MNFFKKLLYPYMVWAGIVILIPMLLITFYAFTTNSGSGVVTLQFTLDNFLEFLNPIFLRVVLQSFWIAFITTVICILIGYPVAYAISRLSKNMQTLFMLLVTIPMWVNILVRTYSLISIISDVGFINQFLVSLNLEAVQIMWTDFAVILGMVYNFLPFMILSIYTVLAKLDPALIQASYDLGANRRQTFMKVVLPLSIPGIVSGITMVFLPAVSSFEIPTLLGGANYSLLGTLIENQFIRFGRWNFGGAVSLLMAVIIMITMHFTRKIDRDPISTQLKNNGGSK